MDETDKIPPLLELANNPVGRSKNDGCFRKW
jgi:hypothetical protein